MSFLKKPLPLIGLNGLAILGFAVSIALTQHFYSVRSGIAGFKTFCNVSETMNCDLVAASRHAELVFGLPLASFAAGWFLALFLFSIIAYDRFWRREAVRACSALSFFGTLFGIFYLLVMAFQLKTYCLLCLGLDAINVIALGLSMSLKPEGFTHHPLNPKQWKILAPLLGVCVGLAVFGLKSIFDEASFSSQEVNEAVKSILETPILSVKTGEEFPTIGPKNAPITLVEFSDFQCPYCRIAAFSIHSVVNRYPNQIKIIFRNFPLDQACNSAVQHSAHPVACEAAKIALCAHQQGKFEAIYQSFFDHQASFAPGRLLEIAKAAGLDLNQLQGCMASPETDSAIAKDIEEANILGIQSTPTFFVNGHRVQGAMPSPVWNQVIDHLLKTP